MKRLIVMGLLVAAMFALVACGGNGDTADTPARGTQESSATNNQASPRFENYYTFGDTFVILDRWEFTFLENPVVIYPVREPSEGELDSVIGNRYRRAYESGIVAFPVIVTNVSGEYQPQGMVSNETIHDPSDTRQGQAGGDLTVAAAMIWRHWF
ncbi:MAG: hypothetical protein FWC78_03840 [Defluviitaleaceae bacterium]|nr:hypothetical protein [Defluviitaleaceae bacterium]